MNTRSPTAEPEKHKKKGTCTAMKIIKEHIKANTYKPVYLIYGTEAYLKKLYRDKLKSGILGGEGDDMNYSHYEGKGIDGNEVIRMADTMPFFAEHRLIVIEESGWFKSQNEIADYLKDMPDTTVIVFVESEVDKRNRLFKAVRDIGYISEMNGMDEANLKVFAASVLKSGGKKVTADTVAYFLQRAGSDMNTIQNELEKLICYTYDREVVTKEDIDAVCTEQITGKIFQMTEAVSQKNQKRALALYYDLLALREKPMTILYLLIRQFNLLLQARDLASRSVPGAEIAKRLGVPPFAVSKYMSQAGNFKESVLKDAIAFGTDIEEKVKTGRMEDQIGVEMLIIKYSEA